MGVWRRTWPWGLWSSLHVGITDLQVEAEFSVCFGIG